MTHLGASLTAERTCWAFERAEVPAGETRLQQGTILRDCIGSARHEVGWRSSPPRTLPASIRLDAEPRLLSRTVHDRFRVVAISTAGRLRRFLSFRVRPEAGVPDDYVVVVLADMQAIGPTTPPSRRPLQATDRRRPTGAHS